VEAAQPLLPLLLLVLVLALLLLLAGCCAQCRLILRQWQPHQLLPLLLLASTSYPLVAVRSAA
jgi:hypothetical protein